MVKWTKSPAACRCRCRRDARVWLQQQPPPAPAAMHAASSLCTGAGGELRAALELLDPDGRALAVQRAEEQEVDFSGKFDPRDHLQPSFNVAGSADKEILQFHFSEAAVTAAA